ncbi:MAG: PAS domain S-box protein [Methylococcaceae bacterium]
MLKKNLTKDRAIVSVSMQFALTENYTRVLYIDSGFKTLSGYNVEDFLNAELHFVDLIHPDDKDLADELFSLELKTLSKAINFRFKHANGGIICLQGNYSKQLEPSSTELQLKLQLSDAKDLKKLVSNQVLLTSFSAMMENTDDYIYFKDRNHVFTGASKTLVTLTKSKHWKELIGKTDYDVFPEAYADNYYRLEKQVFSGNIEVAHEVQKILDNSGNQGWVDNRKYPIKDKSGNIIGLFGIARDITDSTLLEQALKQSEQRFRDLFEFSPDPCWIIENNYFIQCNEAAVTMLGYPDKSSLLKHPAKLSPEYQPDGQLSYLKANSMMSIAVEQGVHRFEWIHKRHDGCCFPVEVTLARIKLNNRALLYAVWRDITERKQAEEALRLSEERYELTEKAVNDGIWDWNLLTQQNYVSSGWTKILGYSKAELDQLGSVFLRLIHTADRLKLMMAIRRHIKQNKPLQTEFRMRHKQGGFRWILVRGEAIRDADRRPVRMVGSISDITDRKQTEQKLLKNERLLQTIFEQAAVGVALINIETGQFERINQCYCDILGFSREEILVGKKFQQLIYTDDFAADLNIMQRLIAGEISEFSMEKKYIHKNGRTVWVNLTVSSTWRKGEPATHHIAVVKDITQRKIEEQKLRLNAMVFENALESILVTDSKGIIIDVNQAFCQQTGYAQAEVLGKSPSLLKSGKQQPEFYVDMWKQLTENGQWRGELWNRKKNGDLYAENLTISAIYDAQSVVTHYIGLSSDISELKQHQEQLEQMAHYDSLTGLPNRALLSDRLYHALAHHQRTGKTLAICYLDLDGFKSVNDSLGHNAGDMLLQKVTQRLLDTVRADDTVARIGGDEFVLLLGDFNNADEYQLILHRLIKNIALPYQIMDENIQVTASIGVTFYPRDRSDADLLLRHADQAMYEAKKSGKGRYHFFDSAIELRRHANASLIEKITQAFHHDQFVIYYQPQVDCRNGKVIGMEALLRWQHPLLGLRVPAEFLPIIEHNPLIIKVGEWLIHQALKQLQQWSTQGIELTISVNIAAQHLLEGEFVQFLQSVLQTYPPQLWGKLKIEITETTALDDISKVSKLIEQCLSFQVEFVLDDFGTGFSTLVQLKHMAVKEVKIDKSFIDDILHDQGDQAIVKGIISLVEAFQQQVVAEGVETIEQLLLLQKLGCDIIQGYCLAKPMPVDQATIWLQNFQIDPRWQLN